MQPQASPQLPAAAAAAASQHRRIACISWFCASVANARSLEADEEDEKTSKIAEEDKGNDKASLSPDDRSPIKEEEDQFEMEAAGQPQMMESAGGASELPLNTSSFSQDASRSSEMPSSGISVTGGGGAAGTGSEGAGMETSATTEHFGSPACQDDSGFILVSAAEAGARYPAGRDEDATDISMSLASEAASTLARAGHRSKLECDEAEFPGEGGDGEDYVDETAEPLDTPEALGPAIGALRATTVQLGITVPTTLEPAGEDGAEVAESEVESVAAQLVMSALASAYDALELSDQHRVDATGYTELEQRALAAEMLAERHLMELGGDLLAGGEVEEEDSEVEKPDQERRVRTSQIPRPTGTAPKIIGFEIEEEMSVEISEASSLSSQSTVVLRHHQQQQDRFPELMTESCSSDATTAQDQLLSELSASRDSLEDYELVSSPSAASAGSPATAGLTTAPGQSSDPVRLAKRQQVVPRAATGVMFVKRLPPAGGRSVSSSLVEFERLERECEAAAATTTGSPGDFWRQTPLDESPLEEAEEGEKDSEGRLAADSKSSSFEQLEKSAVDEELFSEASKIAEALEAGQLPTVGEMSPEDEAANSATASAAAADVTGDSYQRIQEILVHGSSQEERPSMRTVLSGHEAAPEEELKREREPVGEKQQTEENESEEEDDDDDLSSVRQPSVLAAPQQQQPPGAAMGASMTSSLLAPSEADSLSSADAAQMMVASVDSIEGLRNEEASGSGWALAYSMPSEGVRVVREQSAMEASTDSFRRCRTRLQARRRRRQSQRELLTRRAAAQHQRMRVSSCFTWRKAINRMDPSQQTSEVSEQSDASQTTGEQQKRQSQGKRCGARLRLEVCPAEADLASSISMDDDYAVEVDPQRARSYLRPGGLPRCPDREGHGGADGTYTNEHGDNSSAR
uniref:ELMO domain-containing protein n=1 Tax=Macrostomum lignano TaxID=282301 RepID=A0A1I8JMR8_9PLAT